MSLFLINLILAIIWAAMSGVISTSNFVFGFLCGFFVLLVMKPVLPPTRYFEKAWLGFRFTLFFLSEILKSSLKVAYDVITPHHINEPGIIAIPLTASTDLEITMLANLITLTPGTMSLDVSEDQSRLYIHAMFAGDPDAIRRSIKEELEPRLLELMR